MVDKILGLITDPEHMATYSSAKQIAEVVSEAVRTDKEELRYLAGDNAALASRLPLGEEGFRKAIASNAKFL